MSRSPLTGITHNPWKHGYNAGASSAGAGAAAAAGFGPLHQGSDGAGSIRMPSHFCGVFGLKPSFGRVPYYPVSDGRFTSHMGPMTRSVADCRADAGGDGRAASAGSHLAGGRAGELHWRGWARASRASASPTAPIWGRARRSGGGGAGARRQRRGSASWVRSSRRCRRLGQRRAGADPLLLGRAHGAGCSRICRSGKRRWIRAWSPASRRRTTVRRRLSVHARAQDGLCRGDPSLVRGLGFSVDAVSVASRHSRPSN